MAGDLKTQIEIGVDGSGVEVGVEKIKRKMSDLGKAVVDTSKQASTGIDGIGAAAAPAADKVQAATRNMIGSLQRQIAVMEAGSKSGADYYRVLAGQRGIDVGVLKPYLDQLDQLSVKQKAVGVSAAQTSAAMRQLPAQFSDIAVSLQAGQNPLSVFLQQGSQLKDSFGGAGLAARALSGYIASLVNPVSVAAAAVGVLGVAAYKGAQEQSAYQRALILSGNAAGATAGQLDVMAASLRGIGAGTQGQAAEALTALAATGQVGAANLQKFAATAIAVERTIGTSVADTAKAFAELGEEPLKATEKLAKGTGYLTLALYDQIKALEDQGKKSEAAAVAQSAYDTAQAATAEKLKANLGSLEKLMKGITGTASGMWDSILGVGRLASPEASIASQMRTVASLQAKYDDELSRGRGGYDVKRMLDAATANLNEQRQSLETSTKTAAAEGTAARIHREAVDARKENAKWAEAALTATEKTNRALEVYRTNNAKIIADGGKLSASTIAAEEAAIRKANEGPKVAKQKAFQDDSGTKYLQDLREQEAAMFAQLVLGEKLGGAAKRQAEFEQMIADIRGKSQLTAAQKSLMAREDEIRVGLRSLVLTEQIAKGEEEAAKKREKAARDLVAFQDRAAQLTEQIANAQSDRRDGYARTLGGFGKSDAEQQRIQEVNGLYRESLRLQDQLTKATPKDLLGSADYLTSLASIRGSLSISLADHAKYYADLKTMQGSWSLGASSALATYAEDSANVARQMQQATGRAFQGMEDQLVSLATTGKANFKGLIDSVISDVARLSIRQSVTGPLAGAINGLLGGVGRAAFSQTSIGSSGFGTGLAYGNQDMGQFFADGGYTGPGGKYQAAGIVHAGEYVINADSTRKLGLDFLAGLNGYADGGFVAPAPISPNYAASAALRSSGGMGAIQVNIVNNGAPATAQVKQTRTADGGITLDIIVDAVDDMLGDRIASGSGSTTRAIEGRYGLRTAVS